MTERRALGDLDFDNELDNPEDTDGWYGRALVAEPLPPDAGDLQPEDSHDETWHDLEDTDRWSAPAEAAEPLAMPAEVVDLQPEAPTDVRPAEAEVPEASPWTGMLAPRNGRHGAPTAESWQSRLSSSGAWDFKASGPAPWYRSKRVTTVVIAAAVAAVVMTGILFLLRSPAAGVEDSTPVSPTNPTSAGPAPTSPAPALSTPAVPPPLPPPPPPPPPPAAEAPPANRTYTPRQSTPSQSDKPEIGVTRTPVTRVPMSATPPPPRKPDRNSSTPGDGPGGGWGPW